MTVWDLHCDLCGALVPAPSGASESEVSGVRFVYHPGSPALRDDSGLACRSCWAQVLPSGPVDPDRCAVCQAPVTRVTSLHVRRFDAPESTWRLCEPHAAAFLNRLRTVEPKFDPTTFRLPLHEVDEQTPSADDESEST